MNSLLEESGSSLKGVVDRLGLCGFQFQAMAAMFCMSLCPLGALGSWVILLSHPLE